MDAGPSHGSAQSAAYLKNADRGFNVCAGGISIRRASATVRPLRASNSTVSSRLVESDPSGVYTGLTSSGKVAARADIRALLPHTVLISPLCANIRSGCARSQEGATFVAYR